MYLKIQHIVSARTKLRDFLDRYCACPTISLAVCVCVCACVCVCEKSYTITRTSSFSKSNYSPRLGVLTSVVCVCVSNTHVPV